MGAQEISQNTLIQGGNGGHNLADDMGGPSNWNCGEGGDGIFPPHGVDIAENSVHIPVEINWQPYYFIMFVIINIY